MADADALLIGKPIVAAWTAATLTRIWGNHSVRAVISFATWLKRGGDGIFSGVSPAAHSLAAIRAPVSRPSPPAASGRP